MQKSSPDKHQALNKHSLAPLVLSSSYLTCHVMPTATPKVVSVFFSLLVSLKKKENTCFLGKMNTGCKCFTGLLSSLHVFKKKLIIMLCCSHHSLENAIWVITPVPRQNCTLPCGIICICHSSDEPIKPSSSPTTKFTAFDTEKEVNVQIFRCWNKYCLKPVSSLKKVLKLLVFF